MSELASLRGRALLSVLIAAALNLAPVTIASAQAFTIEQPQQISIPAGSLIDALAKLGDQSGVQILFETSLADGLKVGALNGTYSVRAALTQLLADTDLAVASVNEKTVVLKRAKEAARETAVGSGDVEEVLVFGTLDNLLSVGSKSGQSLRETAKSITIVTRERIEEQNLNSLVDALNQTTGVTIAPYSPVDVFFFSRGFRVQTLQLDGGAPAYTGGFGSFLSPDMAVYDHIEMLRGVDGMYTGAGEPGGVINLVRKRARDTAEAKFSASAGSWNFGRAELDITGPLTDDGRLRGRLVGAYQNKDYFYDRAESEKTIFFGTGEYDITPSTLLIAGVSYERRKEDGYFIQGFPRYADGSDLNLPRSKSLAPEWSHWYFTSKEVFARVEQNYGKNGVLKLNVTHLEQDSENRQIITFGAINPLTGAGAQSYARPGDYSSKQNLFDLSASGTFDLFGRSHRYTVGADYSKIDGGGQRALALNGYVYPNGPHIDIFAPFDASLYPEPTASLLGTYPENGQQQNGYYATLGLQLAEPLRLTLGGRYGEYEYEQIYQPVTGTRTRTAYEDSKFIPSAAISWDFASNWTAYMSYAETFRVQANLLKGPLPGTPLDPVTGDGFEAGIKGELGGFNTAFAIYRVERTGQGASTSPGPADQNNGSRCCYVAQGDVVSEGFDAEVSGTVLPGLQLFTGYTYNTNKYEGPSAALFSAGAYFLNVTPKHLVKVWATWQLPWAPKWTINSGVVAQSENYVTGTALAELGGTSVISYRFSEGEYAIWNASVQYQINDAWSIGVYGDNLFDKTYYAVLGNTASENSYGTPRSYVMTLRGRW